MAPFDENKNNLISKYLIELLLWTIHFVKVLYKAQILENMIFILDHQHSHKGDKIWKQIVKVQRRD